MEAAPLRCPGCGAPVPASASQCPYCRAQVATVACPACFALAPLGASHCPGCGAALAPRSPGTAAGAPCPACQEPLASARVGEVPLQSCGACGGLWLDQATFQDLGAHRERQGAVLGALPAPSAAPPVALEPVVYRPCPVCTRRMNRVAYARRSGVILDVCRDHGLWFDRDELRRVLAFIGDGGLDRARARDLEDLQEARRAAERARDAGTSGQGGLDFADGQAQGTTVGLLLGLAAEVADAFLNQA